MYGYEESESGDIQPFNMDTLLRACPITEDIVTEQATAVTPILDPITLPIESMDQAPVTDEEWFDPPLPQAEGSATTSETVESTELAMQAMQIAILMLLVGLAGALIGALCAVK